MLELLKFLGFGIAAAAAVWGLAKKTNFEDEEGNKRLTAAGHVAVAFAVAGALVSMAAYGFELSIAVSREAKAATVEAERKAFEREQRYAARSAEERDQRLALLQALSLSRADQIRAAQIVDGLRAVSAEREARLRDIRLAGDVREGARSNLARTGTALGQLERLVQPLNAFSIGLDWDIPIDTNEARAAIAELDRLARSEVQWADSGRNSPAPDWPQGCRRGYSNSGEPTLSAYEGFVAVLPECSLFPTPERNPLFLASIPTRARLYFDLDNTDDEGLVDGIVGWIESGRTFDNLGELTFDLAWRAEETLIIYSPREQVLTLRVRLQREIPPDGRIISIPDLERGRMIFWYDRRRGFTEEGEVEPYVASIADGARLERVTFNVSGRRYSFQRNYLRQIQSRLYASPPVARGSQP